MSIPYIGFGNETLEKQPVVHAGDKITCPKCGGSHELEGGKNAETGEPSELLLFYHCGKKAYLGAVNNRLVVRVPSDCSGEIETDEASTD